MWKTFKALLVLERSNRNNVYSLLFVALLIIGFMFVASRDSFQNPLVETTAEYQSASSAISKFQIVDVNAVDNSGNLYGRLTKLRQGIALKTAALKLDKEPLFYEASLNVINLREELYDLEGFEKVSDLIPTKIHNDRERVFVQTMLDNEIAYKQDALQYWPFLLAIFSFIGIAWFPFLSFYTSGIMIEDFSHSSVIKGYPVRFDQYVIAKSVTKFFMIVSFIGLIFILSLPLIKIKDIGASNYPVVVYDGEPVAYTIPSYLLLCIAIMVVIAIFTLLLSIILNMVFKNMYLTLFTQQLLYFLPILFPSLVSYLPYNPFNFLNFNMIIEGGAMMLTKPVELTFWHGFIVMGICIVMMLLIVKLFLSTGKLNRA